MPREPSPRRPTCSAGQSPTTCGAQLVHQFLSPHTLMQPRAHLGATRRALLPARGPHSRPPRQRTGEPLNALQARVEKIRFLDDFTSPAAQVCFAIRPLTRPKRLHTKIPMLKNRPKSHFRPLTPPRVLPLPMAAIAKSRPTNACAGRTGRRDSRGRNDGTCGARADEREAWTRDQACGMSVREGAGGSVWVDLGLGRGQKRLFPAPQHLGR